MAPSASRRKVGSPPPRRMGGEHRPDRARPDRTPLARQRSGRAGHALETMSVPTDTMARMLLARLVEVSGQRRRHPFTPGQARPDRRPAAEAAALERRGRGPRRGDLLPLRHPAPAPHRPRLARAAPTCPPPADQPRPGAARGRRRPGGAQRPGRHRVRRAHAARPWPRCSGGSPRDEQEFLRALVTGNVRQGALDSVMLDAIAAAADLPRRGGASGRDVQRPDRPDRRRRDERGHRGAGRRSAWWSADRCARCWPARPPTWRPAPARSAPRQFAVDTKLDGIRIQVHKHGDEVAVFTRSLDEISARLPEVVAVTRSLAATDLVLDGEALDPRRVRTPPAVPGDRLDHGHPHRLAPGPPASDAVLLRPAPARGRLPDRGPHPERLARLDATVARGAPGRPAGHRLRRGGAGLLRPGDRRRPGGRGPQAPRRAVRRRPPRLRLGQGQAPAHPRPGRAGRRVGQRPAPGAGSPTSTSAPATPTPVAS